MRVRDIFSDVSDHSEPSTEKWWGWMCHAWAFMHVCHLPVGGVSMTLFLCSYVCHYQLIWCGILGVSVMKLAWPWAFPSFLRGASAFRATTNPNWLGSCRRHARSRTCSLIFWWTSCHSKTSGSMFTCTRSQSITRPRIASGERPWHTVFAQLYVWRTCSHPLAVVSFFGHRYTNALEAPSANFATTLKREMLRSEDELKKALMSEKRHSNSEYRILDISQQSCNP